jgi:hypothetical protein
LEELGNGKGKLAKASEEGQGPHRAVEPMMMIPSNILQSHMENSSDCDNLITNL